MVKQNLIRLLLASFLFMLAWTVSAASVNALLHRENDPVLGDPNGKVTVVEFFDYQCSHCSNMAPVMARIIKANPDVRFVFKDYPILGDQSRLLARASIAANYQGKYEELNQALFSMRFYSKESILKTARKLGLNVRKLQKDMQSKKVGNQLNENISLAEQLQVKGTPSFYIGKTDATSNEELNYILGEQSETQLQTAITKASL